MRGLEAVTMNYEDGGRVRNPGDVSDPQGDAATAEAEERRSVAAYEQATASVETQPVALMGDVAGHEFHGNQYTSGGGSSDKSKAAHDATTKAQGATDAVHKDQVAGGGFESTAANPSSVPLHLKAAEVHETAMKAHREAAADELQKAATAIRAGSEHSENAKQHLQMANEHDLQASQHHLAAGDKEKGAFAAGYNRANPPRK